MIGIITLFPEEFRLLQDNALVEDSRKVGEYRFFTGELGSHNIVFAQGAPDTIALAAMTQAMIDNYTPDLVFASSAAVTIVPFIETGDIIITNFFVIPHTDPKFGAEENWHNGKMIETDSGILNSMRVAADALGDRDPQTVFGSVLRASENDLKSPRVKNMTRKMGIMAADPSGAAIATVAGINRLPYIVSEIACLGFEQLEKYLHSDATNRTIEKLFNLKLIALTEIVRTRSVTIR